MSQLNKLQADIGSEKEELSQIIKNVEEPLQVAEAEAPGDVGAAPVPDKKEDKKKTKPRFATYVFMDLETTASSMPGLPERDTAGLSYFKMLAQSRSPEDYKNHFDCWKKHLAKRWTPTFSDIAFLAVSAKQFEDLITLDKKDPLKFTSNIRKYIEDLPKEENSKEKALHMDHVPDDIIKTDEKDLKKNTDSPYQFYHNMKRKVENEEKVSFQDAWKELRSWLEELQKKGSVCLVAHNGFFHDFCVLYCELKRIGASVPYGVYYADTMIGVRNIESNSLNYGLKDLHNRFFGDKNDDFHRALKDCRATLEVASAFREKMLKYIDDTAVQLNMTPLDQADDAEHFDLTQKEMLKIFSENFLEHERFFVVVKPSDNGGSGVIGKIIELLWQRRFKLVALKKLIVSAEELETKKYWDVRTLSFYEDFLDHLHSGEVVGMIFQGENVGYTGRGLFWKPKADFYNDETNIATTNTVNDARHEIRRWFTVSIHNDHLIYK